MSTGHEVMHTATQPPAEPAVVTAPDLAAWLRPALIAAAAALAVCVLGGLTLYGYISYRFGEIHKVTLHFLSPVVPRAGTPRGGSGNGGSSVPPMNILVVGSDTRAALVASARVPILRLGIGGRQSRGVDIAGYAARRGRRAGSRRSAE